MDNQSNDQPSSVDDQELAKVLAGVNEQMEKGDDDTHSSDTPGLNLEDVLNNNSNTNSDQNSNSDSSNSNASDPLLPTPPPLPTITTDSRTPLPATPPPTTSLDPLSPPAPDPSSSPSSSPLTLTPPSQQDTPGMPDAPVDPALENIKKDALNELRPLVDKLNISGEEKFDTYLLLLRSTDDKSLLGPAHEAAKAITDETRRAQALLDVIKEIDYLSHNQHAA